MYIYKATTKDNRVYIGESLTFPELTNFSLTKLEESLGTDPEYSLELLTEVDDFISTLDKSLEKFRQSIQEINSTHSFNLVTGRYRVDSYLTEYDMNYIAVLTCSVTGMSYVTTAKNIIDKLYRMFNNGRCIEAIRDDINQYGSDGFNVTIYGPFTESELNSKVVEVYNGLVVNNNPTNIYNPGNFYKTTKQGRYKNC